jgi:hypothetical protein
MKSPPHFLSPIPYTHPTTLFAFLTTSIMCASLVEGVAQVLELAHSFYLPSFPLPLILFAHSFSFVEHHQFRLLNRFFFLTYFSRLVIISFISLSLSLLLLPNHPQTPGSKLSPYALHSPRLCFP